MSPSMLPISNAAKSQNTHTGTDAACAGERGQKMSCSKGTTTVLNNQGLELATLKKQVKV